MTVFVSTIPATCTTVVVSVTVFVAMVGCGHSAPHYVPSSQVITMVQIVSRTRGLLWHEVKGGCGHDTLEIKVAREQGDEVLDNRERMHSQRILGSGTAHVLHVISQAFLLPVGVDSPST